MYVNLHTHTHIYTYVRKFIHTYSVPNSSCACNIYTYINTLHIHTQVAEWVKGVRDAVDENSVPNSSCV
jgi:hypothetical protein